MFLIVCRFLLLATVVLISGCAWQQQSRLDRFDQAYARADFAKAAQVAGRYGDTDKNTGASNDLLWTLQQASALQAAGDHASAARLFDTTERFFRLYDERGLLQQWSGQLLSVLSNDAVLAYQGTVYDAIMVNSYKALSFLAQGEPELARVELNRARDRQRRAADYFADELAQARDQLTRQSKASSANRSTVEQALDRADQALTATADGFSEWAAYPAFINPLATYLQGLFLLTHAEAAGDYGRAADALRETRAMVPGLEVADEDWRWAEQLATGARRSEDLPPTVWVLYENGLGPERAEQRIQLPIILVNREGAVFWTGIAYPTLKARSLAQPALRAHMRGGETARTSTLVSMDAVVGTEFRQRLPMVVTRAVAAAVAKAGAQYQLQKDAHPLLALVGFLYQAVSTQADTRQWTSLPKTIELAKLERPVQADQLVFSGWEDQVVDLPDSQFTLVWVRQPTTGVTPAITVIPLGKSGFKR